LILIDASALLAAIDDTQRGHEEALLALQSTEPPLLLSPFVLAELDYFVATRIGQPAEMALLDEVAAGAYQLEPFDANDIAAAQAVIAKYADLGIGLADASIVVLAERHGVSDILTLDARHFGVMRARNGGAFRLLPDVAP
jgi:predicted nucleic acid-binding protein